MKKLKKIKTLDVQWGEPKIPNKIKNYFFDLYDKSNDVWVEYTVQNKSILDKWLLANTNVKKGELILLKHWW